MITENPSINRFLYKFANRRNYAIIFFILTILLFLPGMFWGIPESTAANRVHPWEMDEIAPLGFGEFYFTLLSSQPRFDPRYPLGAYFVQLIFVAPYLFFLVVTGRVHNFSNIYPYGLLDPVNTLGNLTLIGRLPSLLASAGVVVLAYRTTSDLWDETTGRLAGLLVLLMYPFAYYARTSNVDMLALFWCALGLWIFVKTIKHGLTYRRALAIGAFAALATATKDPSWAVFVSMVPYFIWLLIKAASESKSAGIHVIKMLTLGFISALLLYGVLSGVILNPQRYQEHLYFITHGSPEGVGIMDWYYSNPATLSGYLNVSGMIIQSMAISMGAITLFLGFVGVFISSKKVPNSIWLAIPALGIILGVIMPVRFVQLRFVLIPSYILTMYGAFAITQWFKTPKVWLRWLGYGVVSVSIAWSLVTMIDLNYQLWNDTRYTVERWLTPLLRPGDRVGCADYQVCVRLPHLPEYVTTISLPRQQYLVTELPKLDAPEWLVIIPHKQDQGEEFLADQEWQSLIQGQSGYQLVYYIAPNSFLNYRPLPQISPPVWVFLRNDLWGRVCDNYPCDAITW